MDWSTSCHQCIRDTACCNWPEREILIGEGGREGERERGREGEREGERERGEREGRERGMR